MFTVREELTPQNVFHLQSSVSNPHTVTHHTAGDKRDQLGD